MTEPGLRVPLTGSMRFRYLTYFMMFIKEYSESTCSVYRWSKMACLIACTTGFRIICISIIMILLTMAGIMYWEQPQAIYCIKWQRNTKTAIYNGLLLRMKN